MRSPFVAPSQTPTLALALAIGIASAPAPSAAQTVEISFVHRPAAELPAGRTAVIEGHMLGASDVDIAHVVFRSSVTNGWVAIELELLSGDHYRATIPGELVQVPTVEYYVLATDFLEEEYVALASKESPIAVKVVRSAGAPKDGEAAGTEAGASDDGEATPDAGEPEGAESAELPDGPEGTEFADRSEVADIPGVAEDAEHSEITDGSTAEPGDAEPGSAAPGEDETDAGPVSPDDAEPEHPSLPESEAERERRLLLEGLHDPALRIGRAVIVIEREQILAMGARTLADVLQIVPELDLDRAFDGEHRVALRASQAAPDVLLVLDGHVLNDAYDGRALWTLPARALERVTVRGPTAVAMARPGALAGVVEVETRGPDAIGDRVEGRAALGTHASHTFADGATQDGTYGAGVSAGHRFGDLGLSGFVDFGYSGGSQRVVRQDSFSLASLGSELSQTPGPIRDQRLGLAVGASLTLSELIPGAIDVHTRYFHDERGGYVGKVDVYGPDSTAGNDLFLARAHYRLPMGEGRHLDAEVGFDVAQTRDDYQILPRNFTLSDRDGDGIREAFPEGVLEKRSVQSVGIDAAASAEIEITPGQRLIGGLRVDFDTVAEPTVERNIDALGTVRPLGAVTEPPLLIPDRSRLLFTAHVDDQWLVHPSLDLEMGLRFTLVPDLDAVEAHKAIAPRFAATYRPLGRDGGLDLRLAYASSYRPPTLYERSDRSIETLPEPLQGGRYVGDPRVRAASQHTVELGAAYDALYRSWRLGAALDLWYARTIDAIVAIPDAGTADPIGNRPTRDQLGLRAGGRVLMGRRASLYIGAWWQRTTDTSPEGELTQITSIPQVGAVMSLFVSAFDLLELDVSARYRAERRNDARTVLERSRAYVIPESFVVDAALRSVPIMEMLRFGVSVHNLLDADRRDPAPRPDISTEGVPLPGLSILATVEVSYEPGGAP